MLQQVARIGKRIIQDFDELSYEDRALEAKTALIQSVYYGISGDHDKALKSLKPIRT